LIEDTQKNSISAVCLGFTRKYRDDIARLTSKDQTNCKEELNLSYFKPLAQDILLALMLFTFTMFYVLDILTMTQ